MKTLIALMFLSSAAYADDFVDRILDGNGNRQFSQEALDRQFDRMNQRDLIEDNNRMLRDLQDRQDKIDNQRIFGTKQR
jgi:hypothetical protein